jgi:hypothetical protein
VSDALIRSEIQLKCGKALKNPSLFVELKTKKEGNLIKETVFRYPMNKTHDGMNQIDGFSIPIGNYSKIAPFLSPDLKSALDENHYSVDKRLLLIDPSLYFLFMGLDSDKRNCCDLIDEWAPKLPPIVNYIANLKVPREKTDQVIEQIYPLLDVVLIRNLLEYQIKKNASILINPSVPLSSSRTINEQVEKMRDMNKNGRILFDTLLTRFNTQRDLMNMATLSPSMLTSTNIDGIMDAIMQGTPDIIGIRLMNLDEEKPAEIRSLLQFIKNLSSSGKPVFVFNVREFGYVTLCHGASVISTPIAKSAYTTRKKSDAPPKKEGSYYHSIDMIDYSYEKLPEKIREKNYRLPCHCEICDQFGSLLKVEKKHWNYFRKVHFLLLKNMEMHELRKTEVPLSTALKDKFSRSLRTGYVPFLP